MKNNTRSFKKLRTGVVGLTLLITIIIFTLLSTGCVTTQSYGPLYGYLFLTDTYNGRVYTYNPQDHSVSNTPLLSTGVRASDHIYFYNRKGYITAGWGDSDGVFMFDPASDAPQAKKFSSLSFSAQYLAFYSPTRAFVTDYGDPADPVNTGGVYYFNPSDTSSEFTFIQGTEGNAQDIIIVNDKVFMASNGTGSVIVIDPETLEVIIKIPVETNPTGLCSTPDESKVYVTNTGTGTISVIDTSDLSIKTFATGLTYPTLITYSNGYLYVTGWSNTYYIDTNAQSPTPVELKDENGNSFGGGSILVDEGLIYVTNYNYNDKVSKLYIFDEQTKQQVSWSPISVGVDGEDGITGMAFYE